jgi:hypothetical protein
MLAVACGVLIARLRYGLNQPLMPSTNCGMTVSFMRLVMSDRPLSDHPFCQQEQEPNCFDCGDACATCAKEIERLRAVLQRIADMPVDGYESTIPVRSIARVALEDDNENDNTDGAGVNTDWLRDDAGR